MMIDLGLGLDRQTDSLSVIGDFVDIAKLFGSSARNYPDDILRTKIDSYRQSRIVVISGGQFAEMMFFRDGLDGVGELFARFAEIGMTTVEVSDTYDFANLDDRLRMIDAARKAGLKVHGEVCGKISLGNPETPVLLVSRP